MTALIVAASSGFVVGFAARAFVERQPRAGAEVFLFYAFGVGVGVTGAAGVWWAVC